MTTATSGVRRWAAPLCLMASCSLLFACDKPAGQADEDSAEAPDEAVQADLVNASIDGAFLDAELGPWRIEETGLEGIGVTSGGTIDVSKMAATPVATTVHELQAHMLGRRFDVGLTDDQIQEIVFKTFQKIPDVPLGPRYEDPRYDEVRDAFTQSCTDAVENYQRSLISTLSAPTTNFDQSFLAIQHSAVASSYESECLTALANVPDTIRRVIGVLVVGTRPFCSATIVAEKGLLTSRHCFVDPNSGDALRTLNHWRDGNVSFVPAVAQNTRSAFTVAAPDAVTVQKIKGTFGAPEDYWPLTTTRSMQYAADYKSAPSDKLQYPITAWLVGSNIHLDDIGQAGTPLDFVRGSAPNACALLEKSAAGCVYHTCQSSPSTSGAGILVANVTGGVDLLGVHKGTIAEAATCETSPPQALRLNFAISDINL